jgi:hypothetical protein
VERLELPGKEPRHPVHARLRSGRRLDFNCLPKTGKHGAKFRLAGAEEQFGIQTQLSREAAPAKFTPGAGGTVDILVVSPADPVVWAIFADRHGMDILS